METYKTILGTALFSIPVFVILGTLFLIKFLIYEFPSPKASLPSITILILITIFTWPIVAPLTYILLWMSFFNYDKKKNIIMIALGVTFYMFPILIMFCFFNTMGWAFDHSPGNTKPHIIAIYATLIYLGIIWLPTLIKYTCVNTKPIED